MKIPRHPPPRPDPFVAAAEAMPAKARRAGRNKIRDQKLGNGRGNYGSYLHPKKRVSKCHAPCAAPRPSPLRVQPPPTTMHNEDPDTLALRESLERQMASGTPQEIIYFGGSQPGHLRAITPLRFCETRGRDYIIALCHQSGMEKTFRLDRIHLPEPPLPNGGNDFRTIANCLGGTRLIENMLTQIAHSKSSPMEKALAAHLDERGEFESFFAEYSYGSYTLELEFTSTIIYLGLGYEANDSQLMHYKFTPESEPRLAPDVATFYPVDE